MAKSRQSKELTVGQLTEKLQRMKAVVFTSFSGLSVKDVTELRKVLRESDIDYVVAKKTLLKRALSAATIDAAVTDRLEGGTAITIGYSDEILPAKLLKKFSKDHPAVALVGGIVNGSWVNAAGIEALAKLPGREELIAQTVWTIKGPLTGLVNALSGNLRSLINILTALKDKQPATV